MNEITSRMYARLRELNGIKKRTVAQESQRREIQKWLASWEVFDFEDDAFNAICINIYVAAIAAGKPKKEVWDMWKGLGMDKAVTDEFIMRVKALSE